MMEKETWKHERQVSTVSLTNYRVPSQSVTLDEKIQSPDHRSMAEEDKIEKIFRWIERLRPCMAKYACLCLAVINYFYPHETFITFLLLGTAMDAFSVREAIELLFRWITIFVSNLACKGKKDV